MHVTWLPPLLLPTHIRFVSTVQNSGQGQERIQASHCLEQLHRSVEAGGDNLEYLPIKQGKYILPSIGGKCKQNIIMQVAGGDIVPIFSPAAAVRCGCGVVVGTVCRARVLMTISYISHCSRISEYNYTCGHNRFYNPCGIEVSKKFRESSY